MKSIQALLIILAMICHSLSFAQDIHISKNETSAGKIALDTFIARPLGMIGVAASTSLFIISFPYALLGQNVKQSFNSLVKAPFKETFMRCLGCPYSQND